jgi:hypothetical protein
MSWQLRPRKKDRELNDRERRHLGAVKLFIESVDSRHADFAESLDKMPPRGQRALINWYHLWLENPDACIWSRRLGDWIFPFDWLRNGVAKILARLIPIS